MNRTLVGDIADLHFCPTEANRKNLAGEGITDGVFITGNTVIDALKTTVRLISTSPRPSSTSWTIPARRSFW